jgi:predicted phosphodiesterase
MRVAAIYDIHGNLPALEAVIEEIRRAGVDRIVVGGDVLPGPMPRETLAYLFALDIPVQFISGNGDRVVLEQRAGRESAEVPEQFRDIIRWNAQELRPEDDHQIAAWPKTLRLDIDGLGQAFFCHAVPQNDRDIFTRLTPQERVMPVFKDVDAPVAVCGHTHMQFDRQVGTTRIVNAGSVGMPFQAPGAYWLLLGPVVELRKTAYDLTGAADRIRRTKYPKADDFASNNVLNPPSEQQMLEAYARVSGV